MMFTAPACDFQIPITPTESPSTRKFWDIQDFLPISHYFSSSWFKISHFLPFGGWRVWNLYVTKSSVQQTVFFTAVIAMIINLEITKPHYSEQINY